MVYFKEGKINSLCVYFFKETYLLQSSKDTNRPGNLFSSLITKSKPQMFAKKKTCLQLFRKKKTTHLKPLIIVTESLLAVLRATSTLSMASVLLSHPCLVPEKMLEAVGFVHLWGCMVSTILMRNTKYIYFPVLLVQADLSFCHCLFSQAISCISTGSNASIWLALPWGDGLARTAIGGTWGHRTAVETST